MLRKTIFWLHLSTALVAGLFVVVMSATGVLLTYEKQIQSWADLRGLNGAPPHVNAVPLPVSELVAKAQTTRRGQPSAVRWRSDPQHPVEVVFGPNGSVFLNGYTGEVLGVGAVGVRAFFHKVTDWHRWLGQKGGLREPARKLTAAANVAFLFMVVSGFFLWWPRNWTTAAFRNVLFFRRGLRSKARDFNWHNVVGIWALVPLFIIVGSGVVISYPPVSDLVTSAFQDAGPRAGKNRLRPVRDDATPQAAADLEELVARARARDPQWRSITLQLAPAQNGNVTFSIDRSNGGQPQKRSQLVLAPSGEPVTWEPFSQQSRSRQARSIIRFAHTGEIAGVAGQTIAGLASAAALLLAYTGIALALRRWLAWRRRNSDQPDSGPAGPSRAGTRRGTGEVAARS